MRSVFVSSGDLRLDRKQRHAVRAVLAARVLGAVALEAVAPVPSRDPQVEARGCELGEVELTLTRAGDAGRPEVRLADSLRADLAIGDDVGERDAATRPQDARRFGEDRVLVGREVDHAVRDDGVEIAV